MIYFLLILFFGSLFGITFMIGRKLIVLQNGQLFTRRENTSYKIENLEEWRSLIVQNIKSYSYKGLVGTIRLYVRLANFLNRKYQEIKIKLKERQEKKLSENGNEKVEPNKFLKMISEYKRKIRKIKHQIKEEENL